MIKAGFSKLNITGAFTYKICGYKINDPLFVRCFALVENDKPIHITFSLDFVELPEPFATTFRKVIAKALRIDPRKIVINVTHTHSMPKMPNLKDDYFVKTLITAGKKAINRASQAEISFIKTEAGKGFNINRRWDSKRDFGTVTVIDNSGCVVKNGDIHVKGYVEKELSSLGFPEIKVSASAKLDGPVDPDLTLLLFKSSKGSILGGIVRYASHPTFVAHFNGNIISADYPGFLLKTLEKHFGGDFLFLNGCSGDLRPYSKYYSVKGAKAFGRRLAAKLISASKDLNYSPLNKANYSTKSITLPVRTDLEKDIKKLTANFWLLRERNTSGNLSKLPVKKAREKDELRWANDMMVYLNFTIFKGNNKYITRKYWPYSLGLLSIGPVNYLFFQEEVFSEMSRYLKTRFPEVELNTVSLSNGGTSYLLPNNEIKKGGYEYTWSIFGRGAFETVKNTASKFISKCSSYKAS